MLLQIGLSDFWYFPRFWCQANFSYICLPLSLRIGERIRSIFAFLAQSLTLFSQQQVALKGQIIGLQEDISCTNSERRTFLRRYNIYYLFQILNYQGSSFMPRKSIYFFIRNDFLTAYPHSFYILNKPISSDRLDHKFTSWSTSIKSETMNRRGSEENVQKKQCEERS